MLLAKARVNTDIFKTFKEKLSPVTALDEILRKANRLDSEASRCLGEDGLKSVLDISKEAAKENPILQDAITFGLQMESLQNK